MTVVQFAYDIPEHILVGLASGEFTRFGSVVRDSSRIVTHLKEVNLPGTELTPAGTAITAALKNPKVLVGLGTVVVVLAAAGGVAIWAATKKKAAPELDVPESVVEYNAALAAYLEAIQNGRLDTETLDRLIAALDAIKEDSDSGGLTIEISIEQADALVSLVADYTRKLAEANSVDLTERQALSPSSEGNRIADLRHWLEIQKQAFDDAA